MEGFEFHHFGVAVRDLEHGMATFGGLLGYELTSGPFNDPIQKVSVCFMKRKGIDPIIELVAPLAPGSPVEGTLKQGCGIYHVCYRVRDIQDAIEHLTQAGSFLLSDPVPAIAFGMKRIAWLMTELDLLVELLES